MAKLSGNTNAQYDSGALNLYLALAAGGNKKAYEFMAGNLGLVSLWYARIMFERSRLPPFIHITLNETTQNFYRHFHNILKATGSTSNPIAFTVGVDAMVVVKSRQLLQSHGDIVGGAYPNHLLDIKNKSDEETIVLMK